MKKLIILLLLIACSGNVLVAQNNDSLQVDQDSAQMVPPTIALGIGTISYFGELNNNGIHSPLISRLSYQLEFRQRINYFLEFNVSAFGGQVSANERSIERNLNFESNIFGGSFGLNYNFGNFLSEDRIIEPILGVGISFISFHSKTDLMDANNSTYNYWSDGTIRNLPESHPNAEKALRIQRDYYYETDIKHSELYDLDNYNTFTMAFPITVGANMPLNEQWEFRAAMTYYFTLTDMIDGVSGNNGNFKGDGRNDNLLYTGVSLSYNFTRPSNNDFNDAYESDFELDLMADEDQDGVIDFDDECMATPIGAEVDEKGCPLDGDNDGVPNYMDEELNSAPGAQVDSLGVTIPAEDVALFYNKFYDSLGIYSPITNESHSMQVIAARVQRKSKVNQVIYAVAIGEFVGEIPSTLVNDILSVPDVATYDNEGSVIVAVGKYESVEAARERRAKLEKEGVSTTDIIAINPNNEINTISGNAANFEVAEWEKSGEESKVVYRVQIGAFTKTADESKFKGIPNVIKVASDDGYVRYYSGSFSSYHDAAKAKIDILSMGYKGAFVVAVKEGNKVSLNNINAVKLNKEQSSSIKSKAPLTPEQRKNLVFKVQLASYSKQIPTDMLEKYMDLGNVEQMKGKDNLIRYVAGSFQSYNEANAYKKELISKGYSGSYVIAVYYGKMISTQQAQKMINR